MDKAAAIRTPRRRSPTPGKVARRDEILAIAAAIFARKGFAAATVRDIAAEAGILSGSLYHHFSSKEELFEEIIRSAIDADIEADVALAAAEDFDAAHALEAMVTRMLRNQAAHPEVATIISNAAHLERGTAGYESLRRRRRAVRSAMTTIIARGVAEGTFRSDLDVELAFLTTVGAIDAVIRSRRPTPADVDETARRLAVMFVAAFRAEPSA